MKRERKSLLLLFGILAICNVAVSDFPYVNYTGQSCTPNTADASKCSNNPTLFFLGDPSAWNTTHAFFFRGETADVGCCVSPASNVSSDIKLTLSQRVIAYVLHKRGQNVFPFSTGGQLCWHPSSGQDLCQANLNLQAAQHRMSSNNDTCEYMMLTISGISYDEAGTWRCMSDINSANQAERSVIVGDRGTLNCIIPNTANSSEWATMSCSLSNYSPMGAKIEIRVGKDLQNMENIVSDNSYLNSLVTVNNLSIRGTENEQSCTNLTSIYEQSAEVTYPIHRCQYSTTSGLTLMVNCMVNQAVLLKVDVSINQRTAISQTYTINCIAPTTTTVPTTTTINGTATSTTKSTTTTSKSPSNATGTTATINTTTTTVSTTSNPSGSTPASTSTTTLATTTTTTKSPGTFQTTIPAITTSGTSSNWTTAVNSTDFPRNTDSTTLGPGPIAGIVIAAVVVVAVIVIVPVVICINKSKSNASLKIVTTKRNDGQVITGRVADNSIIVVPKNESSKYLISNWNSLPPVPQQQKADPFKPVI